MKKESKGSIFNTSERDGVDYRKASLLSMVLSQANNGCGICFYLLMMYASYIGTQGYGITTAVVGIILTVMRVFDGFTDTLIAAVFEKISGKLPKIRIFLVSGWLLASLGVVLMYSWAAGKFSGLTGIIVFIAIYVLYIIGYTINGMAGSAIGIMITNDPTQRPMIGFMGMLFSYLTPLAFGNIITFFVLPKYDNQYNMPMLSASCWLYMGVAAIFMILACIGVRKIDRPEVFEALGGKKTGKQSKVGLKEMVAVLKDNKETQRYFWTCVSDKFAQQIGSQSVIATLLNGVLIGSYVATTMIGNFTMVIGLTFAVLGGVFVAKTGAKKSTVVWSWVCIGLTAINGAYCIFLGPTGMSKIGSMGVPLIIWAILAIAVTASKMILTTTANTMRADVVDYEAERSGHYMPAIIAGVYNFIDKLVTSVSSMIAGFCIATIGYVNTVPQMGDKPTWAILGMTVFLLYGLPILGWLINIIAMKNYSLTKERMVDVAKAISASKNEVQ